MDMAWLITCCGNVCSCPQVLRKAKRRRRAREEGKEGRDHLFRIERPKKKKEKRWKKGKRRCVPPLACMVGMGDTKQTEPLKLLHVSLPHSHGKTAKIESHASKQPGEQKSTKTNCLHWGRVCAFAQMGVSSGSTALKRLWHCIVVGNKQQDSFPSKNTDQRKSRQNLQSTKDLWPIFFWLLSRRQKIYMVFPKFVLFSFDFQTRAAVTVNAEQCPPLPPAPHCQTWSQSWSQRTRRRG